MEQFVRGAAFVYNANVLDVYFTLHDAAGRPLTLFLNQNGETKRSGITLPSKFWTSEAAKIARTGWGRWWVCAQFKEN